MLRQKNKQNKKQSVYKNNNNKSFEFGPLVPWSPGPIDLRWKEFPSLVLPPTGEGWLTATLVFWLVRRFFWIKVLIPVTRY